MASHEILFLNNRAMREAGAEDMAAALTDVEKIYRMYIEGGLTIPDKVVLRFGTQPRTEHIDGRINCMPGLIRGDYNMAGVKWIGSGPNNREKGLPRASVTIILNDVDTKLPLCIADGTAISAKRTGASGGVAMKYLSRKDSRVITVCGAGAQGRTQLEAAMLVRPSLRKVYVYDIFAPASESYVREMRARYPQAGFEAVDAEWLPSAVAESDIVVTATLADEAVVKAAWVTKGTLLINMAAVEMEYDCIRMADKVVVDFWNSVKHRLSSTIAHMAADGLFKDEELHAEIGEIVLGRKPGRETDDEIIYYNPVGAGVLDLAVAIRCYRKALEPGIGIRLPYWEELE